MATIRRFRAEDRPQLRAICRETAREKPMAPAAEATWLAPLWYLDPYLESDPRCCLVAEAAGAVVGYVVWTVDTLAYRGFLREYHRRTLRAVLRGAVVDSLRGRYRHLATPRAIARHVRAVLQPTASELGRDDSVDLNRFPAHCHFQLSPRHRDPRVGLALLMKLRRELQGAKIHGQHSVVLEQVGHEGYTRLIKGLGFREIQCSSFTRHDNPRLLHSGVWKSVVLVSELTPPAV